MKRSENTSGLYTVFKEENMARFVKEYANYSIDKIKRYELMNKDVMTHAIEKIKKAVELYEHGMITEDETIEMILNRFSD